MWDEVEMADIAKCRTKLSAILGDSSRCVCCACVQVSVMCSSRVYPQGEVASPTLLQQFIALTVLQQVLVTRYLLRMTIV